MQTAKAGAVDIEAQPKRLRRGDEMIFTLTLDNHSIDLNYDYLKIAVAVDNDGTLYKPVGWTGGSSGHHVSGDLIFDTLSSKASHIGLNFTGVDDQNISFDWEL